MPIPGSLGTVLLAAWPGNPTNVSVAEFNEPPGTVVIDYTDFLLYQKTSPLGDNSGFTQFNGSSFTAPVITGGLTASGSAANDFSGSTGAFKTSSGTNTIEGNVVTVANKTFDWSASNGAFKTSTGATTIGGVTIVSQQALSGVGAVDIVTDTTKFTSTGSAQALSLADGVAGQIKRIIHVVDGGSGVLTPTTKTGYSTITFTNAGDSASLEFVATQGWLILSLNGATAA